MRQALLLTIFILATLAATPTFAWSRPGHMATAAVAYEDLLANNPQIISQIVEIMAKHPDRAPFEVATGSATGDQRARRVFMQMARWPDDMHGSVFDHPTWHYSGRPLVDKSSPSSTSVRTMVSGAALEAYALNFQVAADAGTPAFERAVALCWLFHLTGDLHQPLHAVDQFAARFPDGDRGGNLQFVRESDDAQPITLHAYWDRIIRGTGEAAIATEAAQTLIAKFPRKTFAQLSARTSASTWANESAELAQKFVYRSDLASGTTALDAKTLTPAYITESRLAGEKQATLAGYRLADVLRQLFSTPTRTMSTAP